MLPRLRAQGTGEVELDLFLIRGERGGIEGGRTSGGPRQRADHQAKEEEETERPRSRHAYLNVAGTKKKSARSLRAHFMAANSSPELSCFCSCRRSLTF